MPFHQEFEGAPRHSGLALSLSRATSERNPPSNNKNSAGLFTVTMRRLLLESSLVWSRFLSSLPEGANTCASLI